MLVCFLSVSSFENVDFQMADSVSVWVTILSFVLKTVPVIELIVIMFEGMNTFQSAVQMRVFFFTLH